MNAWQRKSVILDSTYWPILVAFVIQGSISRPSMMPSIYFPPCRRKDMEDEGSIGIGAMIVFIALILVAAVASTIIIKTAEELQQNAEDTSSDTRQQISGKVTISDIFVKDTTNPMKWDHSGGGGDPLAAIGEDCGPGTSLDCHTDVASFEVIARIGSGSLNVQQGDISYYVTCRVTYSQLTPDAAPWAAPTEVLGKTVAAVDTGQVMATEMDGTAIADGEEITAGTTFRFEIDLQPTNVDVEGAVNEDIEDEDFATSTPVGCDAEAGVGQVLDLRIVVDGGGETLAQMKITSLSIATSVM